MNPMTPSAVADHTRRPGAPEITNGVNPTGLEKQGDSVLAGADGALWLPPTVGGPNAMGRIVIPPIATTTGPTTAVFQHRRDNHRVGHAARRDHGSLDPVRHGVRRSGSSTADGSLPGGHDRGRSPQCSRVSPRTRLSTTGSSRQRARRVRRRHDRIVQDLRRYHHRSRPRRHHRRSRRRPGRSMTSRSR